MDLIISPASAAGVARGGVVGTGCTGSATGVSCACTGTVRPARIVPLNNTGRRRLLCFTDKLAFTSKPNKTNPVHISHEALQNPCPKRADQSTANSPASILTTPNDANSLKVT